MSTTSPLESATRVADAAWAELRRSIFVQQQLGEPLTQMPDVSFAEAQRRSKVGQSLLDRLDSLDESTLPHDVRLTLRVVRFRAATWAKEADFYWHVIDPLRKGFFGMFLPSAYCGAFLLTYVHRQLAAASLANESDRRRYLDLVRDYGRLIDAFAARTVGQAERGIRMPKLQILAARRLVESLGQRALENLSVAPRKFRCLEPDVALLVSEVVQPAFGRLLETLAEPYYSRAPEGVGMSQYPGGREIYQQLVHLHTTLDITSEALHAKGLERMAEAEAEMQAICAREDRDGARAPFLSRLQNDPRWRAPTADGVHAVFQRYTDRIQAHLPKLFEQLPRSPCQFAALPEALQSSMTFGYYEQPRSAGAFGTYFFNVANMTQRPLIRVGALAYHELMPGHHVHFASQLENESLHPIRSHSFVNAFNEGWAEYAITLAEELGMFEQPEEQYGRLTHDVAGISRLVVDTGMNALGWSLEQARDYLRQHTQLTAEEIVSETLRYSCDLPAQALAYKIGDRIFLELRERMRAALGDEFDLRKFHSCVLGPGALPLSDLQWHIESEIT
ncbi:MAG TPA: DUF885 domain-containing protein [Steroidobacteraceae bacterium]|nr:DUF885 domain-containing protein [Steroidobacteraceae bacterium]